MLNSPYQSPKQVEESDKKSPLRCLLFWGGALTALTLVFSVGFVWIMLKENFRQDAERQRVQGNAIAYLKAEEPGLFQSIGWDFNSTGHVYLFGEVPNDNALEELRDRIRKSFAALPEYGEHDEPSVFQNVTSREKGKGVRKKVKVSGTFEEK